MKIQFKDLVNIATEKIYSVDIKSYEVKDNIYLRRIEDVVGDISFYYDISDELRVNYEIQGKMICPDAYTLEDYEVDFDLTDEEYALVLTHSRDHYINNNIPMLYLSYFFAHKPSLTNNMHKDIPGIML